MSGWAITGAMILAGVLTACWASAWLDDPSVGILLALLLVLTFLAAFGGGAPHRRRAGAR